MARTPGPVQYDGHGAGFGTLRGSAVSFPAMDINGASAIVTGGASGLGEATARLLAERGAKVVVADLKDDKGRRSPARSAASSPTDVTDPAQVIAAVEAAKELGPLRVLVNCAGIGWATRTIGKDGQYESAHDLDLFRKVDRDQPVGTFNCIRLAATAMSRPSRSRTTSGAPSSTPRRSPPSTARSARPPTRRRRAASSA